MEGRDEKFMRLALRQARKGLGRTSPNPAVGAVIVRGEEVLAKGYHQRAGAPHAEVDALDKLGGKAPGATMYVTLEPCNHYGRTPPCTEAILQSGIRRVVIGMPDPNPAVKGGGAGYLRSKGLEVITGVLDQECRRFYEAYTKFVKTSRPFVTLKSALTLDGWTATRKKDSKWITSERSRRLVHSLRAQSDGIMVGVGTVLADDPSLTARKGGRPGPGPTRIIVDTRLRSPLNSKVFQDLALSSTVVVVADELKKPKKIQILEARGVKVLRCPTKDARIDLTPLMDILGNMNIMSLLVEGGARIAGSLLRAGLVDKFMIFLAPKLLLGGDGIPMAHGPGVLQMERALLLKDLKIKVVDRDVLVTGYPEG